MANFTSTTLKEYTSSNPFLKSAARVCYIRSSKVIVDRDGEERRPLFLAFAKADSNELLTGNDGRVEAVYVGKGSEAKVIESVDNGDTSGIQISVMTAADGRQVPTASMRPEHHFASI